MISKSGISKSTVEVRVKRDAPTVAVTESEAGTEMPALSHPDFERLMEGTAIPFEPNENQKAFAEVFVTAKPGATRKYLAIKAGVNEKTLYNWFQDIAFCTWLEDIRRLHFMFHKPLVDKRLVEMAMRGSYKHMELYYTLVGDLRETTIAEKTELSNVDNMTLHEQYAAFTRVVSSISGRLGSPEKKDSVVVKRAEAPVPGD